MRLHGNYEKRLAETREEIARLRESLRVLDEQVGYQGSVAEEAATRAIVAGTPLADRERRTAAEDLRRLTRHRDELTGRIAALTAEQDDLLERLLSQSGDR